MSKFMTMMALGARGAEVGRIGVDSDGEVSFIQKTYMIN